MSNNSFKNKYIGFFICILLFSSCKEEVLVTYEEFRAASDLEIEDWTTETHSNSAAPNYEIVFNQTKVNRIDIVLSSDEYNTMQSDLQDLLGESSTNGADFSRNPVYVAADFYFNGIKWYEVGVRYKGNSTLKSPARSGINKLPLRLKFDKYEDEYPEINNQRFYGFKDLSLSSGYKDPSFIREKIAPELFREFGVAAPQTAFYEVWVDQGDGTPKYYGLYTMVEVVFDTMLDKMFGSASGNCYKPDGEGARFGATGFSLEHFEKKTNEEAGDWSDIQNLYNALHASTRTTDIEKWKQDLEALFDVDWFLKYLAVNNSIQNWDTYGRMTHNYYLYHDPADDKIKWIPWDNNEAFNDTGAGNRGPISHEMTEVNDEWPLISFIVNVPEYRAIYNQYLKEFNEGPFLASKMSSQYAAASALVSSSATSEESGYTFLSSEGAFTSALIYLQSHAEDRNNDASSYLNR